MLALKSVSPPTRAVQIPGKRVKSPSPSRDKSPKPRAPSRDKSSKPRAPTRDHDAGSATHSEAASPPSADEPRIRLPGISANAIAGLGQKKKRGRKKRKGKANKLDKNASVRNYVRSGLPRCASRLACVDDI